MIVDMLEVPEHPKFQWLFRGARSVGDAVWVSDLPMLPRAEWPKHHLVDDFVGARSGASRDEPRPAPVGPRIITGDWDRATLTCVFPVEFASHGVHGRAGSKELDDVVLSVAAAYEFGLGTEAHLSRGEDLSARFLEFLEAQDVPRFVAAHGGAEGIGHYIGDVVALARGGDLDNPVTERSVEFTTAQEKDLERQLQLVQALIETQIVTLYRSLIARGLGEDEIVRRIADASSWSEERVARVIGI